MTHKRTWEIGAALLLLTTLAVAAGGYFYWRERQRSLNRQLVQALRDEDGARVSRLVSQGADIRLRDESGTTVLTIAAGPGDPQLLDRALAAGLDVNAMKTGGGHTPLIYAAVYDRTDAIRKLLAHGADPNLVSGGPLLLAARGGKIEIVQALLQGGADPDLPSRHTGVTPLMRATERGHPRVVELLLRRGAAVNAKDRQGETALSRARRKGFRDIVGLLLAAGAKDRLR